MDRDAMNGVVAGPGKQGRLGSFGDLLVSDTPILDPEECDDFTKTDPTVPARNAAFAAEAV